MSSFVASAQTALAGGGVIAVGKLSAPQNSDGRVGFAVSLTDILNEIKPGNVMVAHESSGWLNKEKYNISVADTVGGRGTQTFILFVEPDGTLGMSAKDYSDLKYALGSDLIAILRSKADMLKDAGAGFSLYGAAMGGGYRRRRRSSKNRRSRRQKKQNKKQKSRSRR